VLGAQANAWTEHMPSMAHVEHAVFPRLAALAEVDWSPAVARDWGSFVQRLPAQLARYRSQSVAYADSAFAPQITLDTDAALATGQARVTLATQAEAVLRYTLDGSAPTADSAFYGAPFLVTLPVTVRAAAFTSDGVELSAPRTRVLDRAALYRISGNALANCPGSDFRLRVQPLPDAVSLQPVYSINVFDTCQMVPAMALDGVLAIHVDAVRLVRNYALAHEAKRVVSRPHSTPFGELLVHRDRCDGPLLASMPLPDPARSPRRFALDAALPAASGAHALCLIYTAPIDGPLYAFDEVSLQADAGRR
jgi:hexosaminidase